MIVAVFWAFAFLVTVPAAPLDRFRTSLQLTDPLPDALMLNDYLLPSLKSIASYTSPFTYLNKEPSPVLPIDSFSQLSIQPPPELAQSMNDAEAGQSNFKPMTVPLGLGLDAVNTAQADSLETLECTQDKKNCRYCRPSSGCAVYTMKCEKSNPDNCSLCGTMAGVVAPVCIPFDDHMKSLPLPRPTDSYFDVCKNQKCGST